jgi:hypothetical protein
MESRINTILSRTTSTTDDAEWEVPSTRSSILSLPWDVYVTNLLLQPCMTFQDCYNALLVTHGASLTCEDFETMLAEPAMDRFWAAKFKSLYPKLHTHLLEVRDLSPTPEEISWFSRIKSRSETSLDISRILVKHRREKLRCRLDQHEERQNAFLCRFLASDPTDIRFPCNHDRRGRNESSGRCMPTCSVAISETRPPQEPSVYGLELGRLSSNVLPGGIARNSVELRDRGQFFAVLPSNCDLLDVDIENPLGILKMAYVMDELESLIESKGDCIFR